MDEQQAIRERNATMHFQARNRLKQEGLSFHNPELAYLYEAYREELHQWEKLGAIDMAQECRITLDELAGQDEEERAAFDAYWADHADEAYDAYIDEQNMDYHQEAA
jgi:hypothetical protein